MPAGPSSIALACASLAALLATQAPAIAQAAGFHPSDYGRAQLPTRQSTGDSAAYIEANKGGAFEPVGELDADDPLAALARPIGRLDVVLRNARTGEEIGTSCTGALLAGGVIAAPIAAWLVRHLAARVLGTAAGGLIILTNSKTLLEAVGVPGVGVAVVAAVVFVLGIAGITWAVKQERRARASLVDERELEGAPA